MKKTLTMLLTLTLSAMVCAQKPDAPQFPETKAGKRGDAFVRFINSVEASAVGRFIEEHMTKDPKQTKEDRVKSFGDVRSFLGGSKLMKVLGVTNKKVSFIIQTKRESFARVELTLDPDRDSRIVNFGVQRASEDSLNEDEEPTNFSEAEALEATEKYLNDLLRQDKFSGSVIVAKGGKPIFEKAYGYADRDKKIKNRVDTKFNIGSINKIFTMLSIGILADRGKLAFSDTIGKHLPEYPNKNAREKVTITHLLTMSSGIGDIFGDEYEATPKSKLRTIDSYLPLFASKPLQFEPGTDRRYSNGGFLVLGAIIEKTSGQTYYDFVRENITKPIGMKDTESYESDANVPNRAEGYMRSRQDNKLMNNVSSRPARGSSGGGGYSTAPDLLRFANALESGSFQTPESLKKSKDPTLRGLANGNLRFGGGSRGLEAVVTNRIGKGYTVIVLSNLDPPAASRPLQKIRKWLPS